MIDDGLKGILTDFEGGSAFDRKLETTITEANTRVSDIPSRIPTQFDLLADHVTSRLSSVGARYTATAQRLVSFKDHVSRHFDEIADNITLFSSSQQLENAMTNKPESSCGDMHSFFGSVTQEGPSLVSDLSQNVNLVLQTIDSAKQAYTELQQEVASVRTNLLANLDQQIALEVSDAKRILLVDLKGQVNASFAGAKRDQRDTLLANVISNLTGEPRAASERLQTIMASRDDQTEKLVFDIDNLSQQASEKESLLGGLITSERSKIDAATKRLTQLSSASNLRSLYRSDPCVQTLMGYVGSDSLLKKLG